MPSVFGEGRLDFWVHEDAERLAIARGRYRKASGPEADGDLS